MRGVYWDTNIFKYTVVTFLYASDMQPIDSKILSIRIDDKIYKIQTKKDQLIKNYKLLDQDIMIKIYICMKYCSEVKAYYKDVGEVTINKLIEDLIIKYDDNTGLHLLFLSEIYYLLMFLEMAIIDFCVIKQRNQIAYTTRKFKKIKNMRRE